MTLMASLMDGLLLLSSLGDLAAKFSFHKRDANSPPARRNPVDNSKGPVGPRWVAAKLAN